jgi:asparagine synthase (glutamine-hydrolysing)
MLAIAERVLSRSGDRIHSFMDGHAFIAFFDNGAYEPDRALIRSAGTVTCVSGDPLIVADNGLDNDPAASARVVAAALAAGAGDDVLERTKGSFSAASWNGQTRTLMLCADALALRPVYVYLDAERCVFATNLRTLRKLMGNSLDIDEQGLAEHLLIGQSLGGRTVHRGVRLLRPAELLTIGTSTVEERRYSDWSSIPRHDADENAICVALYKAFIQAIRRRSRRATEDAFLSGGLDSRCVVAGLMDIGRSVRTFGSSYENSADHVIGNMVARAFGTEHTAHLRDPYDYLVTATNHAVFASMEFPRGGDSKKGKGRFIWSGDGGSVGMGHVYLDEAKMALVAGPLSDEALCHLFGQLAGRGSRTIHPETNRRMRRLALAGLRSEFEQIQPAHKERRLFLFYLLNDQMRHLYLHYEEIDLHGVEFVTPFYDRDFLTIVVASPVGMFLRHHLYNLWVTRFKTQAASLPWQVYPGHEPGPHALPQGIVLQWRNDWYRGHTARRISARIVSQILRTADPRLWAFISRMPLRGLRLLNLIGIEWYNYELQHARRIFEAITGETIRR